jgi:hypothetical protein
MSGNTQNVSNIWNNYYRAMFCYIIPHNWFETAILEKPALSENVNLVRKNEVNGKLCTVNLNCTML